MQEKEKNLYGGPVSHLLINNGPILFKEQAQAAKQAQAYDTAIKSAMEAVDIDL